MAINETSAQNKKLPLAENLLLIDGEWVPGEGEPLTVLNKFQLTPCSSTTTATAQQIKQIVGSAQSAFKQGAPSPYDRGEILEKAAVLLEARMNDLVSSMQAEAGFTASDAAGEVRRCMLTLKLSAEESRRLAGDMIPISGAPNQEGRLAFTLRVPLGVVVAITPFNSPLNTVAHKIGPAFAAGNSVVLKPSSSTPGTANILAEVLMEAGIPDGFLSVAHGGAAVAGYLLDDQRVRFFAFTGSTEVGKIIQQKAGLRRTQMELGSIAFTILCDDADLKRALPKVVGAGYRKAGQVCTSVQMLMVHEYIMPKVKSQLVDMVGALKYGDPYADDTQVGPIISEKEAERVESWILEAIEKGADCLVGGTPRDGAVLAPTLLANINSSMRVNGCEVFGPVVCLVPFSSLADAIDRVNDTPFGLAAGLYTNRMLDALAAAKQLEMGGVHINETSSSRVDLMPYGGSKDSGFGREGPAYTIHEMTEERIITIATQ